jgi:hypothetical protein
MTLSAWIMLGLTWGIVLFFTGKFFLMALRKPSSGSGGE